MARISYITRPTRTTDMNPVSPARFLFFALPVLSFVFIAFLSSCNTDTSEEIDTTRALLRRGYGINSATLVVDHLDSAQAHYRDVLGFDVPERSSTEGLPYDGAVSASIGFADMSNLFLISVLDTLPEEDQDARLRSFLDSGQGVLRYSLSSSATDSTRLWLSSRGFAMDSVRSLGVPNRRSRNSAWATKESTLRSMEVLGSQEMPYMPTFEEYASFPYARMHEWKTFYLFQREFMRHPNGVVGFTGIDIVVDDLERAREALSTMGLEELETDVSEHTAVFRVMRNQTLRLTEPRTPESEHGRFLEMRGPGIYGLTFEVEQIDSTYTYLSRQLPEGAILRDSLAKSLSIGPENALGIQLDFVQEPDEQAEWAQQLKLNFGGELDSTARAHAAGLYTKYCALCHGPDREGYAADHAPSLKSHSLLATSQGTNFMRYTVQYGRANTAMAGYYKEQGGPLDYIEIELLLKWLYEESGVEEPIEVSRDPVPGDVTRGAEIYANTCASCHGSEGEGISAPALGHPMLLATATDGFLKYAIENGRDGTPMIGFKDSLSNADIDNVTAFLRSRASGWSAPQKDTIRVPEPEEYILNPNGERPKFELREGLYLSAAQLNQAMKDSMRIVILDARSEVAWRQTHIPGAIPVPYYEEPEKFLEHIPDSTWIVAYCACPHAASGRVVSKLRESGYTNTAIMDEGILVWAQRGYPVRSGN